MRRGNQDGKRRAGGAGGGGWKGREGKKMRHRQERE